MTLFSKGGGNIPVKNSHSFSVISYGLTPLRRYKPKDNRSTLNNELAILLNIILFM